MRYALTFNTTTPRAKISLHDAACRNAVRRPGRTIAALADGTSYQDALTRAQRDAQETGRKWTVCKCVNAKGPAVLRDILHF